MPDPLIRNRGTIPGAAKGRTVRVKLFNGKMFEAPADGPKGVRWDNHNKHPFDIEFYEIT